MSVNGPIKHKNLEGKVFGRLTVLRYVGNDGHWLVRCECGNEREKRGAHLVSGAVITCGKCLLHAPTHQDHAHSTGKKVRGVSRVYSSWSNMKDRTTVGNTNYVGHSRDPSWDSFKKFYSDMGDREKGYVLSRHDFNSDYTPQNCFWEDSHSFRKRLGNWITENRTDGFIQRGASPPCR